MTDQMASRFIVVGVVQNRQGEYLLCRMPDGRGVFPGEWGLPGGGIEPGETQERDVFVLTTSFTTYLTRPMSSGRLRSVGRVVNRNKTQFIAEAVLSDSLGREVG